VHPMLASIAFPGFGASLRSQMALMPNVCATLALMIDGFDPGEKRRDGHAARRRLGPRLDYPFTDRMYECFRAGMKAMAQIHLANGAREIVTFHEQSLQNPQRGRPGADSKRPRWAPTACRSSLPTRWAAAGWGQISSRSVVDPQLRHHAMDNLFVVDGSVFPTSLGVNPMESIYGIASWASDHVRAAVA